MPTSDHLNSIAAQCPDGYHLEAYPATVMIIRDRDGARFPGFPKPYTPQSLDWWRAMILGAIETAEGR